MTDLKLQSLNGKKWPDFFGEKEFRSKIESEQAIKTLLKSDLLLSVGLNKLLSEILTSSTEVDNLVIKLEKPYPPIAESLLDETINQAIEIMRKNPNFDPTDKEQMKEAVKPALRKMFADQRAEMTVEISQKCNEVLDLIDEFRVLNKVDCSNIVNNVPIFTCSNCKRIISKGSFRSKECPCGNNVSSSKLTEQTVINTMNPSVREFFRKNIWLEYGVERLFEKAGFQTVCGAYILGISGVKHEIDVLGENKETENRVLAECKNKTVGIDEIFKLYGKMSDVGCNYGLMFTTATDVHLDVKRVAKSKNIKIFSGVLGCDEKSIVEQLKEENII
jgi:hypothetical protein